MKKFSETFEKTITLCRIFSLGIGITKVQCIAMASIRSFEQQHSNSRFLRIPILLAFFSAKSANSTVFRIPIPLVTEIFLCEVYRFQKTSQTSDAQKNTPLVCSVFVVETFLPTLYQTMFIYSENWRLIVLNTMQFHIPAKMTERWTRLSLNLKISMMTVKRFLTPFTVNLKEMTLAEWECLNLAESMTAGSTGKEISGL